MGAYETIKKLCDERGIAVTALEKELGYGRGSIGKMRTSKASAARIREIADYFGVTSDYIYTGDDTGYYLNEQTALLAQKMFEDPDMRSLFDMKRNMNPQTFKNYMDFMKAQYKLEHPEEDDDFYGC